MSGHASSRAPGSTPAGPSEVAEPGSFLAADAGGIPVLVTRDTSGELRAFINVCRHRGAVLTEGCGTRASIQCHYHAWTYDLDGSLRAAPRSEREPGFDRRRLVASARERRHLGAVPLREPRSRRRRRSTSTSAPCPRSSRATSTSTGSRSTRASTSDRTRTGRSWSRTSSSATTARPRTRASAPRSTCIPTATCSRRTRRSRRSSRRAQADRRARPVPPPLPEHRHQRLPRSREPLDRADRAERHRPDRAVPRLLLRARRRPGVARRVLRASTTRSAARTGRSSSRCTGAWRPGMLDHGRLLSERRAAARRVPVVGDRVDTLSSPTFRRDRDDAQEDPFAREPRRGAGRDRRVRELAARCGADRGLVPDGQDGPADDRHRQPGLPAVVRRRHAQLEVEDQRPGDRQGL